MTPAPMRTLAIDPGTRRVGLALSDSAGKFATPFDVLQINNPAQVFEIIAKVIESESVERIVVGLPLNMDGSQGPAAKSSIAFARELSKLCHAPVIFVDERLSSFQAESDVSGRRRQGEKITRKQKKSRLDAHAAAIFLQDYLDGKLPAIPI